jgi:hypothetical protein
VTLPQGYALKENHDRNVRCPVVYVLHGYEQDPHDLEAAALITNNFMNDPRHSYATRLPKLIVVYVDGRCRIDPQSNEPECIRGTFYMNSERFPYHVSSTQKIAPLDDWFMEVVAHIDATYRRLPPSDTDWVE